MGSSDSKQFSI
uniref:Uncharacterized protein n=1 Tax=Anguilla anguilla TaxID=7936 RepID=A0A0E9TKF1_ANGAN